MKLCRILGLALAVCLLARAQVTPEQLFQSAKKAERAGETVRAYLLYSQASAAAPENLEYWKHAQALRPLASLLKDNEPKPADLPSEQIDRTLFGAIPEQDLEKARRPLPPPELKAQPGTQDFDLHGDSKAIWEKVAAAWRLMIVFDTQYQPTKDFRFQLNGANFRDTLHALEAATNSFLTPISQRLIFVANDTTQKRTEFETTEVVVIPFPETISTQELQEITTAVRGTLDIQKLLVDNQRHLILVKDRVTKIHLAEKLFQDLMRPHPQVAIEVEIMTTDRSSSLSYGLNLPTAFNLVSFFASKNLLNSIPAGVTNFMTLGGGASLLGFGVTNAQLFATASKGNAKTILNTEVVALNGLPTTLHVGEKYPIQSEAYIGNTGGGGAVFTPPPAFTFEDLGLVLKITPFVQGIDVVTLEISAEFKLLGASSVDGIPVISSRKYESRVSVGTGEWAVLAGLVSGSEAKTITGIPILSKVPLFRSNTKTTDDSETLIVLKPHILVAPPSESATFRAWCGTETRLPTAQ